VRDLASLTAAEFEAALGSAFEIVATGSDPLEIRLTNVVRLPERPGYRQPFCLQFHGPPSPVLEQVVHRAVHAEMGELDIFLGPVASHPDGTTYEAVFA
jgi:hypothetical protein